MLYGGEHSDTMYAGYDYSNDFMLGNSGNDTMLGSWGHNAIYGGADHDVIQGGAGNDLFARRCWNGYALTVAAGNDNLAGDAGHNYLYGGIGNDALRAGDSGLLDGRLGRRPIHRLEHHTRSHVNPGLRGLR